MSRRDAHPRLVTVLAGYNFLIVGIVIACALAWIFAHVKQHERDLQEQTALRGGVALSTTFAEAIEREWNSLRALSQAVAEADYGTTRDFFDAVPDASSAVTWVGMAAVDGTIIAATDGLREGEVVTQRRWFREGMRGENAGSVFSPDAGADTSKPTFVNLSMPVTNSFGEVTGVVVYRISMLWVDEYLSSIAAALKLDAILLSKSRDIVAQSTHEFKAPLTEEELTLAGMQLNSGRLTEQRDGARFVAAVIPNMTGASVPDFGWNLVVRVPAAPRNLSLFDLSTEDYFLIALFVVSGALLIVAANRTLISPISRLVGVSRELVEGKISYPELNTSSREASELSDNLSTIQTRLEASGHFRQQR